MSVTAWTLRDFDERDLPALVDLWVAAWRASGLDIDFEGRRAWLVQRLGAHRTGGGAIVVGLDEFGKLAGFLTLDQSSGYLDQLCVAPDALGSGLARALLDQAKRLAHGAVELDVNEANERACRFYKREGFDLVTRGASALSGLPTLRLRWSPHG